MIERITLCFYGAALYWAASKLLGEYAVGAIPLIILILCIISKPLAGDDTDDRSESN